MANSNSGAPDNRDESIPAISEWFGAIAVDAINIQSRLDLQLKEDLKRMEWLASKVSVRAEDAEWMRLLLPHRLRVETMDFTFSTGISITREQGFEIRALPLNVGFMLRASTRTERHSTVTVSVAQVPTTAKE